MISNVNIALFTLLGLVSLLSGTTATTTVRAATTGTIKVITGSSATATTPRISSTGRPMSTTPPGPKENFFYVMQGTTVCVMMLFNATFRITYPTQRGSLISERTIELPFNARRASANGTCGITTQSIVLLWSPPTQPMLSTPWPLTFTLSKSGNDYSIHGVAVRVQLTASTFPDLSPNYEGSWRGYQIETMDLERRFKTPVGGAFRCKSKEALTFLSGAMVVETNNFKIEAFRRSQGMEFSRTEVVCAEDSPSGSPSSVAAMVISIILITLAGIAIAAFFFRQRKMRNSYQQMS